MEEQEQNKRKTLLIVIAIVITIILGTIAIIAFIKSSEPFIDKGQEDTDIKTLGGQDLQACLSKAKIGDKRVQLVSTVVAEYLSNANENTKTLKCTAKDNGKFEITTDKNSYKLSVENQGYIEANITLSINDNTIFEFDTKNYPRKYIENDLLEQYLSGSYVDYNNARHGYRYAGQNRIFLYSEDCVKDEMEYIEKQAKQKIYDLGADAETLEYVFVSQRGFCKDLTL